MTEWGLNVDLGEGFLFDEELMQLVNSCNIACGGHTGTDNSMKASVKLAIENNVAIGAHPSYPDPDNFGRKKMNISTNLLKISLENQINQLIKVAKEEGTVVKYIKPHGALYNESASNIAIAQIVIGVVKSIKPSVALMGLSGSKLEMLAEQNSIIFIKEGFADRRYNEDGTLVSRNNPLGVLNDSKDIWKQVFGLVGSQEVNTIQNKTIPLEVDSICFHGDSPKALEHLSYVVTQLKKNKISTKNAV